MEDYNYERDYPKYKDMLDDIMFNRIDSFKKKIEDAKSFGFSIFRSLLLPRYIYPQTKTEYGGLFNTIKFAFKDNYEVSKSIESLMDSEHPTINPLVIMLALERDELISLYIEYYRVMNKTIVHASRSNLTEFASGGLSAMLLSVKHEELRRAFADGVFPVDISAKIYNRYKNTSKFKLFYKEWFIHAPRDYYITNHLDWQTFKYKTRFNNDGDSTKFSNVIIQRMVTYFGASTAANMLDVNVRDISLQTAIKYNNHRTIGNLLHVNPGEEYHGIVSKDIYQLAKTNSLDTFELVVGLLKEHVEEDEFGRDIFRELVYNFNNYGTYNEEIISKTVMLTLQIVDGRLGIISNLLNKVVTMVHDDVGVKFIKIVHKMVYDFFYKEVIVEVMVYKAASETIELLFHVDGLLESLLDKVEFDAGVIKLSIGAILEFMQDHEMTQPSDFTTKILLDLLKRAPDLKMSNVEFVLRKNMFGRRGGEGNLMRFLYNNHEMVDDLSDRGVDIGKLFNSEEIATQFLEIGVNNE